MTTTTFTATSQTFSGKTAVTSSIRNVNLHMDEPCGCQAADTVNPIEMMLSALASCQCLAAKKYAAAHDIPIHEFNIELHGDIDPERLVSTNGEADEYFQAVRMKTFIKTSAPPQKIEQFRRFISHNCPLTQTMLHGVHIAADDIVIELEQERAPATVNNFLTYLQFGTYNGTIFHRVIDGFVIQGGGFSAEMQRVPSREPIQNESKNGVSNLAGTVAMARTRDPHSATNQFYINLRDNKSLDYGGGADPSGWGYTVFGRVVAGMDVVKRIGGVRTGSKGPFRRDVPLTDVVLKEVVLLPKKTQQ